MRKKIELKFGPKLFVEYREWFINYTHTHTHTQTHTHTHTHIYIYINICIYIYVYTHIHIRFLMKMSGNILGKLRWAKIFALSKQNDLKNARWRNSFLVKFHASSQLAKGFAHILNDCIRALVYSEPFYRYLSLGSSH